MINQTSSATQLTLMLLLLADTTIFTTNAQKDGTIRRLRGAQSVLDRSLADADQCTFDFSLQCKVFGTDLPEEGVPCDTFIFPTLTVEPCQQTPLTTTMLYNGGTCNQADNADILGIVCQDGETASPPVEQGELSYLVVTDAQEQGTTYFAGNVEVGSNVVLDGQGELMDHGFVAKIYDSQNKTILLQQVSYSPSLCSSPLELLNSFGSLQLVEYTNQLQGTVSPFKSFEFNVTLDVILTGAVPNFSLDSYLALTSFGGALDFADFTDQVNNSEQQQQPATKMLGPVVVNIPIDNVDLTITQRNFMFIYVSATEKSTGRNCRTTEFLSFTTGGNRL